MLITKEYDAERLYHPLVPAGFIPPIEDPEGIYPYESYVETSARPIVRKFRFVSIENAFIRVTVCPDLGGKVDSIFDKISQKEVLFQAGSVRAARILPRMAFLSGGIEVSFPISHTPVQIEKVHYRTGNIGGRHYVWCGEREIRFGMQWTVEYSLGEQDRFLTQRTTFYNPTAQAHSWMSWSNAAVDAYSDTEFHFPGGNVLVHGDELGHIDWQTSGPRTVSDISRMTGYFWENPDCNAFGVYTPSRECGLYHIAEREQVPGIKLWAYGMERHEKWSFLSSLNKQPYLEIQAGPLQDQSVKHELMPEDRLIYTEYWIPSTQPLDIRKLEVPDVQLASVDNIPLFDWVERRTTAAWLALLQAHKEQASSLLPQPPAWYDNEWPPSGMEQLGEAIAWAIRCSDERDRVEWGYYLAVWFAGCDRREEAMAALASVPTDWARALEARLLRCWRGDAAGAAAALSRISSDTVALHPQVTIERDLVLSLVEGVSSQERMDWLSKSDALADDGLIERMADCLIAAGEPQEADQLLRNHPFNFVHQRYERTQLWKKVQTELGSGEQNVPEHLGEDDLAQFGLYRVTDEG